jgi:hypothetical protein
MNKISILNKIITNIGKQESLINIILIPKDVSKTYISSVLKSNSIKNTNIYYMDEYVFKVNKIDQKKLIHDDAIYLENILSETDSIFDKYNLTQESENIINLIKHKSKLERHIKSFDSVSNIEGSKDVCVNFVIREVSWPQFISTDRGATNCIF